MMHDKVYYQMEKSYSDSSKRFEDKGTRMRNAHGETIKPETSFSGQALLNDDRDMEASFSAECAHCYRRIGCSSFLLLLIFISFIFAIVSFLTFVSMIN